MFLTSVSLIYSLSVSLIEYIFSLFLTCVSLFSHITISLSVRMTQSFVPARKITIAPSREVTGGAMGFRKSPSSIESIKIFDFEN